MDEESLFVAALGQPTAARRAFLDQACAADPQLRERLERLLTADEHGGILDRGPGTLGSYSGRVLGSQLGAGQVFADRFVLRQKLGAGGMGEVWVADQTEPVQRRVALKVIRHDLDSAHLLARFDQERQALALMDHPNIAKVFDAGVSDGVPFFAMELVEGVPITQYCDARRLTPRQRLELFVPVCQAIQHAHQKGIIHRDVKPSNVLVAEYDGRPVPKVIDFGVAKAVGAKLTDDTVHTGFGSVVGSLEHMAPEQATFDARDVDTRADVYALGVLLYELLTGGPPLCRSEFGSAGVLEMLQVIREVEPPRPSSRLAAADDLPARAAARGTDPRRLPALFRGELDCVVMKCLEKDRDRRYETASGLARDVQRYLADEVVEARPPSTPYRVRKFVRRNKGRVAMAVVLVALGAGVVGTGLGFVEARRQQEAAGRQRERAEREREAADRQRERADAEAAIAQEVNGLLMAAIQHANPHSPNLKVRLLLDEVAARLDGRFADQPKIEAALRLTVGRVYSDLGLYPQSIRHLERALALSRRAAPLTADDCVRAGTELATAYRRASMFDRAERLNREFLAALEPARGPDHQHVLTFRYNLGLVLLNLARTDEAEWLLARALFGRELLFGADSLAVAEARNGLGTVLTQKKDYAGALAHHEQALAVYRRVLLSNDTPPTLVVRHNVAGSVLRCGDRAAEALVKYERLVATARRTLGPTHIDTLAYINGQASCYHEQKKYDRAESLYREAVEAARTGLPEGHADTILYAYNLGRLYQDTNKYTRADGELSDALRHSRKTYPAGHEMTLDVIRHLIDVRFADGRAADAEPLVCELLDLYEKRQPTDWSTFYTRGLLGRAVLARRAYPEAERHLLAGYRGLVERRANIPPARQDKVPELADHLVELYSRWGKSDDADKWRVERAKGTAVSREQAPPPRPVR
jgi:eukaryotic-like serine/threonine-protein kinase